MKSFGEIRFGGYTRGMSGLVRASKSAVQQQTLKRVLVMGCLGGLAAFGIDRVADVQDRVAGAWSRWKSPMTIDVPLSDDGTAQLPSARRSPEEVVHIQVAAMHQANPDLGVRQCFVFASPGNQMMNGPLPRFARLLAQPPYDTFRDPQAQWVVSTAAIDGGEANVLVSLLSGGKQPQLHLFRFELSQQKLGTLRGCWMTDAVVEIPALSQNELDAQ